jgi:hypothetical protein
MSKLLFLRDNELAYIILGESLSIAFNSFSHSVVNILETCLSSSPTATDLVVIFELCILVTMIIFEFVIFELLMAFHTPVVPSITWDWEI